MPRETEIEIATRLGDALTSVPVPIDCHVAIFVFRQTPEGLNAGFVSGIEMRKLKQFMRTWWQQVKPPIAPKETIH